MKRKDWKIKKLKKNIYGKFFKKKVIFFLRKLFLRKNYKLIKKNLIPHFFFYKHLLNYIFIKKHFVFKNYFNKNKINYINVFPKFFLEKKIYKNNLNFNSFIIKNNLDFYFDFDEKKIKLSKGSNLIIFDKYSNKIINKDIFKKLLNEDEKNIFFDFKYDFKYYNLNFNKNFNFFYNFNLYILYNLEIYKIIIILYMLKLK